MSSRSLAIVAAAVLLAPVIASCKNNDDPTKPTVTLKEATVSPTVSTVKLTPDNTPAATVPPGT
jgi:hypothetical protein